MLVAGNRHVNTNSSQLPKNFVSKRTGCKFSGLVGVFRFLCGSDDMGPASREEVSTSDQLSVAQRLSSRQKPVPRRRVSIEFAGFLTDRLRSVVGRNGAIPTISYTKFVTNPKGRSVSLEGLFREDSNPLRLHDSATRLRPATEASVVGCENPGVRSK